MIPFIVFAPLLALFAAGYAVSRQAIGTLEPRKNLEMLIVAFGALPPALRAAFPLVLAGAPGWGRGLRSALWHELAALGHLRPLGYVPAAALPALYSNATCLCQPSFYEGFGMPVAEVRYAVTNNG